MFKAKNSISIFPSLMILSFQLAFAAEAFAKNPKVTGKFIELGRYDGRIVSSGSVIAPCIEEVGAVLIDAPEISLGSPQALLNIHQLNSRSNSSGITQYFVSQKTVFDLDAEMATAEALCSSSGPGRFLAHSNRPVDPINHRYKQDSSSSYGFHIYRCYKCIARCSK